jgi:hypothetical protein
MFHIEPTVAEASRFELDIPNGQFAYRNLELPPALLIGVAPFNRATKLDLSGPGGNYEPPVDRVCLVLPSVAELGAGPHGKAPPQAPEEQATKWSLPTVIGPTFDVQRPASRDLADFG